VVDHCWLLNLHLRTGTLIIKFNSIQLLVDSRRGRTDLANNFKGRDETASLFLIFGGQCCSHETACEPDELSFSCVQFQTHWCIDPLQFRISRLQSYNLDLTLMISVVESLMHSWVSYIWIVIPWQCCVYCVCWMYTEWRGGEQIRSYRDTK